MFKKNKKQSLYTTLGIIIISIVTVTMFVHATYTYDKAKEKIIFHMKQSSKNTALSLQKNLSDMIESYAINEYDKLILHEMTREDNFAIIVEDYNMGKILGKGSYISGKIRDENLKIVDFNVNSKEQKRELKECYFMDKYDINNHFGKKIGTVTIYISDNLLNSELNSIIISTVINSLVISFLLIVSLFFAINIFILKPLSNIVKVIKDIDEDGLPTNVIPNHGSLEIFMLSNTMNNMINSIKNSQIELKKQHAKLLEQKNTLHYQAHYDFLTALPNRILFNKMLNKSIKKAAKKGSKIALLFVDLDHFKEINDSLGHNFGDKILKNVAASLENIMPENAVLSRLGGDEFIVILENLHRIDEASNLSKQIIEVISQPIHIDDQKLYISSSIGISIYPDDGETSADLFKYADAAMYKAKSEGRNNFQYYSSEMTQMAHEKVFMQTSLRMAIENDEFVVYYQPQIDAKDNKLIGMEALVRWQHPTMGLVSPAKFIPLAESTGLIVELDRVVMKSAIKQLVSWQEQGFKPGVLAMNLSIKQLHQKDFYEFFKTIVSESGVKPQCLELEVTESQIMINPKNAIKILNELGALGIELAIDDFGTGYSSLSYLKKLPINKLKIDQSFIRDLPQDEEDAAITKAIIALSKSLNLKILAEGVERIEQREFLIENGCDNIQGYLYSQPLAADEFEKLFLKEKS